MQEQTYKKGEEVRLAVFGPEYAANQAKKSDEFTRPMREFGLEYNWASLWGRPGLDYKTRGFINIAILAALKLPNQLGDHVRGALRNGATPSEIGEVLLQSAVYAGVAVGAASFGAAMAVVTELGLENQLPKIPATEPGSDGLLAYGRKVREEVFGPEHVAATAKAATDKYSEEFREHQFAYVFGAVWGRGILNYKMRSLLNVASMAALGRPAELELYMKSAIRHGATPQEIREVLLQISTYAGVPAGAEGFKIALKLMGDPDQ